MDRNKREEALKTMAELQSRVNAVEFFILRPAFGERFDLNE